MSSEVKEYLSVSIESVESQIALQFSQLQLGTKVLLADRVTVGGVLYGPGTLVRRGTAYVNDQPYVCGVIVDGNIELPMSQIAKAGFQVCR